MKQKRIVIYSFIIYVVLTSLHRLFDSFPPTSIDMFVFSNKSQDIQWYIKDTFDLIGFAIILYALHRVSQKSLKFTTGLFLINAIVQIPLYYLFYLRYDIIINFIIIIIILIKIKYDEKRINYR